MVKYNDIPVKLCNDEEFKTILQDLGYLETGIQTQHDIDESYEKFCTVIYSK